MYLLVPTERYVQSNISHLLRRVTDTQTRYTNFRLYDSRADLKLTITVIYNWRRQPFSIESQYKTGYWQGVCHFWFPLHGLIRAARSKMNNSAHCGARTYDPWIAKPLPLPLANGIWYTSDKLKLNQLFPVLFISTSQHAAEFCRVYSVVIDQYLKCIGQTKNDTEVITEF